MKSKVDVLNAIGEALEKLEMEDLEPELERYYKIVDAIVEPDQETVTGFIRVKEYTDDESVYGQPKSDYKWMRVQLKVSLEDVQTDKRLSSHSNPSKN